MGFPNVVQNYDFLDPKLRAVQGEEVELRGQWSAKHFGNDHPIVLELACGGGEYTLGLAEMDAAVNFIGVDIKGNRIWKGARKAIKEDLTNVAFLRTRIEQIDLFFGPSEVSEIWITFPDPFPRKSKANRRLTNVNFLARYQKILQPGGKLHLKTDAAALFQFSVDVLGLHPAWELVESIPDVYAQTERRQELNIKSFYERSHLEEGRTIQYLQAILLPKE